MSRVCSAPQLGMGRPTSSSVSPQKCLEWPLQRPRATNAFVKSLCLPCRMLRNKLLCHDSFWGNSKHTKCSYPNQVITCCRIFHHAPFRLPRVALLHSLLKAVGAPMFHISLVTTSNEEKSVNVLCRRKTIFTNLHGKSIM